MTRLNVQMLHRHLRVATLLCFFGAAQSQGAEAVIVEVKTGLDAYATRAITSLDREAVGAARASITAGATLTPDSVIAVLEGNWGRGGAPTFFAVELKVPLAWHVVREEVSRADELNGLAWRGQVFLLCAAYRVSKAEYGSVKANSSASSIGWQPWRDCTDSPGRNRTSGSLVWMGNTVAHAELARTNGRWSSKSIRGDYDLSGRPEAFEDLATSQVVHWEVQCPSPDFGVRECRVDQPTSVATRKVVASVPTMGASTVPLGTGGAQSHTSYAASVGPTAPPTNNQAVVRDTGAPFDGVWIVHARAGIFSYMANFNLHSAQEGQVAGESLYAMGSDAKIICRAQLTVAERTADSVTFGERVTSMSLLCPAGGIVRMKMPSNSAVTVEWARKSAPTRVSMTGSAERDSAQSR